MLDCFRSLHLQHFDESRLPSQPFQPLSQVRIYAIKIRTRFSLRWYSVSPRPRYQVLLQWLLNQFLWLLLLVIEPWLKSLRPSEVNLATESGQPIQGRWLKSRSKKPKVIQLQARILAKYYEFFPSVSWLCDSSLELFSISVLCMSSLYSRTISFT
jgi:hypothetical protein